jgi:heat-inducible transcriptional repressor
VNTIPQLTERRRQLLRVIVQEYVEMARPVGSETIVVKHNMGVSPATVRNEMAVLEQLGLIRQTHTSAGRVPSDEGYRYYVEHLLEEPVLSAEEERTIRHQFYQVQLELDEWMRLSAAIMARTALAAALVTAPRASLSKLKHLELIAIHESLALLVAVFDGGNLQQQMFVLPELLSQDDLRQASSRLNDTLAGLTATAIEARQAEAAGSGMAGLDALVYGYLVKMMRTMDDQANGPVHYDGLSNILNQPEFTTAVGPREGRQNQVERVIDVIQLVQQGVLFNTILPRLVEEEGVQVIIGGEGGVEELRHYSMVLARYGATEEITGLLGVFGPSRMHYGRAISIVRYMTRLMTSLARDIYGI